MGQYRDLMQRDLQIRGFSVNTQLAYLGCVKSFVAHFRRPPDQLGLAEINAYQQYLTQERRISWSYFNQVVCALRFFYRVTLRKDWNIEHIPYLRGGRRLPQVLSREEVRSVLEAARNIKHRAILSATRPGRMRSGAQLGEQLRGGLAGFAAHRARADLARQLAGLVAPAPVDEDDEAAQPQVLGVARIAGGGGRAPVEVEGAVGLLLRHLLGRQHDRLDLGRQSRQRRLDVACRVARRVGPLREPGRRGALQLGRRLRGPPGAVPRLAAGGDRLDAVGAPPRLGGAAGRRGDLTTGVPRVRAKPHADVDAEQQDGDAADAREQPGTAVRGAASGRRRPLPCGPVVRHHLSTGWKLMKIAFSALSSRTAEFMETG
jgi:hypothetical protein